MKRKLVSVLLVSAMTMGLLAGCGGSSDTTSESSTTETATT